MASKMSTNWDGSENFQVETLIDNPLASSALSKIADFFKEPNEMSLLYFSGHGASDGNGYYLAFHGDASGDDRLINLQDVLKLVISSPAKNKIIILDSCKSGGMGTVDISKQLSVLNNGIAIVAACKSDEVAKGGDILSAFTDSLNMALDGAAADFNGEISVVSLYNYIDKFFSTSEQRPILKINSDNPVVIRKVEPRISKEVIERTMKLFSSQDCEFSLNPSFEITNQPGTGHDVVPPLTNMTNVAVFEDLQKMVKVGLILPTGEEHMYFAAMNSKSCHLTPEGKFVWRLVQKGVF